MIEQIGYIFTMDCCILIVLVDLDVNQIVGYHYFDHHQPWKVAVGILFNVYFPGNREGEDNDMYCKEFNYEVHLFEL